MGASVSIDFRINGADALVAMTRTVSQSLDQMVKNGQASAKVAARAELETLKSNLRLKEAAQRQAFSKEQSSAALVARERIANTNNASRAEMETLKSRLRMTETVQRQAFAREKSVRAIDAAATKAHEANKTQLAIAASKDRTRVVAAESAAAARVASARVAADAASARQKERLQAQAERRENAERVAAQGAFRGVMGAAVVRGIGNGASAIVGAGRSVIGGIASGAGIDASLAHGVRQRMTQEQVAVDLSNSGLIRGAEGPNGKRVKGSVLAEEARAIGAQTAIDPTKILEGMAQFTSVSGDLDTARKSMGDLAMLAKATGSDVNDVAAAAGNVAAQLGDNVANKGEVVASVMRTVAAQGKLGAVEIKDMASQMAKLAARSAEFSGGNVEGTMASLGALAQEARSKGGAASASQAATSVGSFINQFSKGARRKEMKAAGVKIEDDQGLLLDPEELMINMLKATKGDKEKMGKLIADAQAQRVSRGFMTAYNAAGGGAKGETAVREEFKRLKAASMGKGAVKEDFDEAMSTSASKAELFQQRLDKLTADFAEKVMPSLVKLAPVAERLFGAFSGIVQWAANNPFAAVVAVMTASIAKEMAAAGIGEAIKRMLSGGAGAGGGTVGSAGAVGAFGAAATGAVIGLGLGAAVASGIESDQQRRDKAAMADMSDSLNTMGSLGKGASAGDRLHALASVSEMSTREDKGFLGNVWDQTTAGYKGVANGDLSAGNLASMIPQLALLRGVVGGGLATQSDSISGGEADKNGAALRAALEGTVQKTEISGGKISIDNAGEIGGVIGAAVAAAIPKTGRDATSQPITGNLSDTAAAPLTGSHGPHAEDRPRRPRADDSAEVARYRVPLRSVVNGGRSRHRRAQVSGPPSRADGAHGPQPDALLVHGVLPQRDQRIGHVVAAGVSRQLAPVHRRLQRRHDGRPRASRARPHQGQVQVAQDDVRAWQARRR